MEINVQDIILRQISCICRPLFEFRTGWNINQTGGMSWARLEALLSFICSWQKTHNQFLCDQAKNGTNKRENFT